MTVLVVDARTNTDKDVVKQLTRGGVLSKCFGTAQTTRIVAAVLHAYPCRGTTSVVVACVDARCTPIVTVLVVAAIVIVATTVTEISSVVVVHAVPVRPRVTAHIGVHRTVRSASSAHLTRSKALIPCTPTTLAVLFACIKRGVLMASI